MATEPNISEGMELEYEEATRRALHNEQEPAKNTFDYSMYVDDPY
jgi:hypothetical protein